MPHLMILISHLRDCQALKTSKFSFPCFLTSTFTPKPDLDLFIDLACIHTVQYSFGIVTWEKDLSLYETAALFTSFSEIPSYLIFPS